MIAGLADESVYPTEQHSRNQNRADEGVGRGPGGPPHKSSQAAKIFRSSSTVAFTSGASFNQQLQVTADPARLEWAGCARAPVCRRPGDSS